MKRDLRISKFHDFFVMKNSRSAGGWSSAVSHSEIIGDEVLESFKSRIPWELDNIKMTQ